jgi:flagellar FliJ protein
MSHPAAIQPLLTLLEQAQRERDESLSAMERGRKSVQEALAQAQSLRDWRNDYQTRWGARFQQGGRVEIIRCYQDFMSRLDKALEDQEAAVAQRRATFEQLRAQVLQREQRLGAVTQLIERRQRELALAEQRIEQKMNDELAARLRQAQPSGLSVAAGGVAAPRQGRAHPWSGEAHQDFMNTTT